MPELPEVETIRRGLEKKIIGQVIEKVEVRCHRIILRPTPQELQIALARQTIRTVSRRGKFLILEVGDYCLLIHLGMTGQLTYWDQSLDDDAGFFIHPQTGLQMARHQHPVDKHTHVSFFFINGNALHYRDTRQFGKWRLYRPEELAAAPEFKRLGLEPFTPAYNWKAFQARFQGRSLRVKSLLLDQRFVAGVGNIYADEALFDAGIHPRRLSLSLTLEEKRRLFRAIPKVLRRGLKYGGTSFQNYINADGRSGSNQQRLRVYGREGKRCLRCKRAIERIIVSQRSSHFCPHCQPKRRSPRRWPGS